MKSIDARRLSKGRRQEILDRDSGQCGYCADDADEVDHIIPWSHAHNDRPENLIAACWLCNHIASNKMFDTLLEKKNHILRRKDQILKKTVMAIWTTEEIQEMGPGMRRDVRNNCIVVETRQEALDVGARLKNIGFEVVIGK